MKQKNNAKSNIPIMHTNHDYDESIIKAIDRANSKAGEKYCHLICFNRYKDRISFNNNVEKDCTDLINYCESNNIGIRIPEEVKKEWNSQKYWASHVDNRLEYIIDPKDIGITPDIYYKQRINIVINYLIKVLYGKDYKYGHNTVYQKYVIDWYNKSKNIS